MKTLVSHWVGGFLILTGFLVAACAVVALYAGVDHRPSRAARAEILKSYAQLPLSFHPNRGQADLKFQYLAAGRGYQLLLTPAEIIVRLQSPKAVRSEGVNSCNLRITLLEGNTSASSRALAPFPGELNYLIGNDRTRWLRNVPTFGRIEYRDVYPGIDLAYYGNQEKLEYDFIVTPHASAEHIRLAFDGAHHLRVDERGDLVVLLDSAELRFHRPVAYQNSANGMELIRAGYRLASENQVSFVVDRYDSSRELIIDPILSYSTFIGGSSGEGANGIAVDSAGNAYIVGTSLSADYPITPGAFSSESPGIIVSKLNPRGSALLYSTFVGGTAVGFGDEGLAIAVDDAGQATITGNTISRDFPTTANAFDRTCGTDGMCNQDLFGVNGDAFLTVFNSSGTDLVYSTYIGGTDLDFGRAVTIDQSGKTYVAGSTLSPDLPTGNVVQKTCGGGTFLPCSDGYVAKFDTHLSGPASLLYLTYLGGNGDDIVQGVAADRDGNAYLTGQTISTNFPVSANALDRTCGDDGRCDDINSSSPGPDAFATKISAAGSQFAYSTYLGANGSDAGSGIAVDTRGMAYVTGLTQSTNFPTTIGSFRRTLSGIEDAFVTVVNFTGTALNASTYLGGELEDTGSSIAVDTRGNAHVVGTTDSPNFPTTPDRAFGFAGGEDAFLTKLDSALKVLIHSTYLGGSQDDFGKGIALSRNATFVAGFTHSGNFPTTARAFDRICGTDGRCNDDRDDVFVSRFVLPNSPTLFASAELSETFIDFGAVNLGKTSPAKASILTSTGDAPLLITSIVVGGDFAQTNNCGNSLPPGAQCQIDITFTPTAKGGRVGQVIITDNASDSPQIITLTGSGIANARASLSPGDIDFGNVKIGTKSQPRIETIKSIGSTDLIITDVFVGVPFSQTNDCIGHPIPPGGQCTVNIVYAPTETGGDFTIFQLTDNTSQFIGANITGTGVP